MEKPILLIADGQEEFRSVLADMLRDSFQIRQAADGRQAQTILESLQPDMLVVNLVLPELDGVSLLHWARERGHSCKVLALTLIVNEYVQQKMEQLQVDYLMQKPCSMRALTERIQDLCRQELWVSEKAVTELLLELGVQTNLDGYRYLQKAIPLYAGNPRQTITKELYFAVGKACRVSAGQVERSIRTATQKAWSRRNDQVWQQYLPVDTAGQLRCPSNGEFISRLAGHLLMRAAQRRKTAYFSCKI